MKIHTKAPITIHLVFRFLVLALFLGGIVWYTSFQSRNLISGPHISFISELDTVQAENTIEIEGKADNITSLTLNGNPIYTDEEGIFRKSLVLENGYTIMTLRAKDRFGRTISLSKSFVYAPQTSIN